MENIKKEKKIATFEINKIEAKTSAKGETFFVIGGFKKPMYVWDKKLVEALSNNEFDVGDKVNIMYEEGKYLNVVGIEFLDVKINDNQELYKPTPKKENDFDDQRQKSIHRSVSVNNTALIMSSLIEKGFVNGFDINVADEIFNYFLNKLN